MVWFEVRPRRLVLSIVREADCRRAARSCLRRHGFWGRWIEYIIPVKSRKDPGKPQELIQKEKQL